MSVLFPQDPKYSTPMPAPAPASANCGGLSQFLRLGVVTPVYSTTTPKQTPPATTPAVPIVRSAEILSPQFDADMQTEKAAKNEGKAADAKVAATPEKGEGKGTEATSRAPVCAAKGPQGVLAAPDGTTRYAIRSFSIAVGAGGPATSHPVTFDESPEGAVPESRIVTVTPTWVRFGRPPLDAGASRARVYVEFLP